MQDAKGEDGDGRLVGMQEAVCFLFGFCETGDGHPLLRAPIIINSTAGFKTVQVAHAL